MSTAFEIPEWLFQASPPPPQPVDDHRVEALVNRFIADKQEALFTAPDAYYRLQGADALDGRSAIDDRLQALRAATLDLARDDGERAALEPRLDLHIDDAADGIVAFQAIEGIGRREERLLLAGDEVIDQRFYAMVIDRCGWRSGLEKPLGDLERGTHARQFCAHCE